MKNKIINKDTIEIVNWRSNFKIAIFILSTNLLSTTLVLVGVIATLALVTLPSGLVKDIISLASKTPFAD